MDDLGRKRQGPGPTDAGTLLTASDVGAGGAPTRPLPARNGGAGGSLVAPGGGGSSAGRSSDASVVPRGDAAPPAADASETDAAPDHDSTAPPDPCLELERRLVLEWAARNRCVIDSDCTVGYDDLCGAEGALIGNRGCFLPMPTGADLMELRRLNLEYRASPCSSAVDCDCPSLPAAICVEGRCVENVACARRSVASDPGIRFVFPAQPCTFTLAEVAQGIQLAYQLVVDEPISNLTLASADWGLCSTDPVAKHVSGGGQSYCVCDTGLCDPEPVVRVDLPAGTEERSFFWDGVNWIGPSDFGNPKGPPFPPGEYAFTVEMLGTRATDAGSVPFFVQGTFVITLVP